MNFCCPKCTSQNTQAFRMIYECGVVDQVSETEALGVTYSGQALGVLVGNARTSGRSSQLIAQRVSPPERQSLAVWVWLVALPFLPLILIPLLYTWKFHRWNRDVFPQLLRDWERSWLCLRCGHEYQLD